MAKKNNSFRGKDYTPFSGSPTDVARLGRGPKPGHEQTAFEDKDPVDWSRLAQTSAYKDLIHRKIRFIVPACVFFIIYYFALPILVGFAPQLMATPVWGKVNLAYLFALSQFFMAWILAGLYVAVANRLDKRAREVLDSHQNRKGGK